MKLIGMDGNVTPRPPSLSASLLSHLAPNAPVGYPSRVTPRLCPRCHSILQSEDSSSLVFCWNCGAPQVVLSEEFRDQLEQQQLAANSPDAPPPSDFLADPAAVIWSRAIQFAGLAGLVYVGLSSLSMALLPLQLLTALWVLGAPIVVLGVYCARIPKTQVTTTFGAQIGMLTGLAISLGSALINTITLLIMRFGLHSADSFEIPFSAAIEQIRKQQLAQSTSPDATAIAQHLFDQLKIPEFRVGFLFAAVLFLFLLYIVYTAAAGAFSGLLRSKARTR
jgi:hypothetical protein